jgi:hypothetical protein
MGFFLLCRVVDRPVARRLHETIGLSYDHRGRSTNKKTATAMKMIAEYVEHAIRFEQMAKAEQNPRLKADLQKQAEAYRKLAQERANKLGLPRPPGLPSSDA